MELNVTCEICGKREHDPDPDPMESWQVWLCDECTGAPEDEASASSAEVG